MRARTITLLTATLLGGCGAPPSDAAHLLGADRQALFDRQAAAIDQTALVSTAGLALVSTTLASERARALARFRSAVSASDVYYALLSLKNSLHDAHATFTPPAAWQLTALPAALEPTAPPVALPIAVRVEYDDAGQASYHVHGAALAGDAVLTAVDGVPMAALEQQLLEWYPFHSPAGLREFVARSVASRAPKQQPTPAPGTTTQLTLQGAAQPLALRWSAASSGLAGSRCEVFGSAEAQSDYGARPLLSSGANYCIYDGGAPDLRIVRWPSFEYADLDAMRADESQLLSDLRSAGATRVLFDVRENGGGLFDPDFYANFTASPYSTSAIRIHYAPALKADPKHMAQLLFMDPANVPPLQADLAAHPSADFSFELPFVCQSAGCPLDDATRPPATQPPLRAIVLTGPACWSACDQFVATMKDNGIALTAGQASAGSDSPRRDWARLPLADGQSFDLVVTAAVSDRPHGQQLILEANPPPIDFAVPPNASNRGAYLDAVLNTIVWPQ